MAEHNPRVTTEEELRRSEERFRLLMEAVDEYAIYMLDPQGYITTWNAGAEKIKGYKASEIVGKNFALFFPPEDLRAQKPQRELEHALSEGRFEEVGRRVRKDGSEFVANVVITPVRDDGGMHIGFAKVTRDLTERVRSEENARNLAVEQAAREAAQAGEAALRESEERYRALSVRLEVILEGLADGVAVQDRTGRLVFANRAGVQAMGLSPRDAHAPLDDVAKRFEIYDEHGDPIDLALLPGRRVLRGEPSNTALLRVIDPQRGDESWRVVKATGVAGSDGTTELAISMWHDVTEDRRREQHDAYLAKASAALAESLDYTATLSKLADVLVPGLGDWCVIQLLEGDQLSLVALGHTDPVKLGTVRALSTRYPVRPHEGHGVWHVLRTGQAELHEHIPEGMLADIAQDAEHLAFLRELGMRSALTVPIRTRDRVVGTLSLVAATGSRRYQQHDLKLLEELGRRAGSAIENARLYAAQKKARDDLALLAQAGESFALASSYEDLLATVVQLVLPTLGDFAFLDVRDAEGVRRLALAHDDQAVDALVKQTSWARWVDEYSHLCALSNGQTGYEPHIDDAWKADARRSPEHVRFLQESKLRSMVSVPLRSLGELFGALTVCFGKSGREHARDDVRLIEELARRAAISIDQARLFTRAREAARSAEEANRLKDEFLATVSHELRTPLNAILGWASLLRTRTTEPGALKAAEIIHRNALAQGKIIEDILDTSRIITGKLRLDIKATDLSVVVRDAIEILRPSISAKQLQIEYKPPQQASILMADPERLQQVVWNVLSNAVKFTDAGGLITASVFHQGEWLVLKVEDTGRGIAPEFLPYAFDRFKQADGSTTRRVGGLGLGLAIVRHLVELHGGHVEASSAGVGQGSTFRIALPMRAAVQFQDPPVTATTAARRQLQEARATRALVGLRVLVVDDEVDARELLATVLSEAGAAVESAASAAEGLRALTRFLPDVLISDIGMPDEDGYAFVRRIRQLPPEQRGNVPAIALTAYTRSEDAERALAAGFTRHLGKPWDPGELLSVVASLATTKRGSSPRP